MKLSWASSDSHASRNAEIAAMLTARAHGSASAWHGGSSMHPGIYVHAVMTSRDGMQCFFCSGAGCGRCDITDRVCARPNVLRCEVAASPKTGGIPKGVAATHGASNKLLSYDKKKFIEEYSQRKGGTHRLTRRSVSLTDLTRDESKGGALLVGSASLLTGVVPAMDHMCSPKNITDSESNSGASLLWTSESGGETTVSDKFCRGRCIGSPQSSDVTPTATLENSSDSGGSRSGCSPRSCDGKSPPKPQVRVRSSSVDSPMGSPICTMRSPKWQAQSPCSVFAWRVSRTSDLRCQKKTLMNCQNCDSPHHLSDSESHSGASLSGTTTASEQCSRGSFFDSPTSSDATPAVEIENSSDSGRSGGSGSAGSPRSDNGKSPLEPQVRVRSSSVDSPIGSPTQTPRFTHGHGKSGSPWCGKTSADRQRSTSFEPSSINRELWHQAAVAAKEKGAIFDHEFKCLKEEMSELASDFCRLRAFVSLPRAP